jgi:hypothetical protein
MFLIDASTQNAFALFKMQNEETVDVLRARKLQLEYLAFDLLKYNVRNRYEFACRERFSGRKISNIKRMEEFLDLVCYLWFPN